MNFSTIITVDGQPVTINVPKESRAWKLANSVFCPLGPIPSRACLVMTKKALTALTGSSSSQATTHTIVWTQTGAAPKTLTLPGWRLVKSERLLQGGPSDSALYLVEFADARWVAANNSVSGPVRANIRSYAQHEPYLAGTDATWTSLVESLWTTCGVLGAYPGLPAGLPLDGIPENTFLIALNSWKALTAVLENLDCAVKHDPLTNLYTIVQYGAEQTLTDNPNRLKVDYDPITSNAGIPETIKVHFYYHYKGYGQERDTERTSNYVVVGASDIIEEPSGVTGAEGEKILWDDVVLSIDEFGIAENSGAVLARAANRIARYKTRMAVQSAHKLYSGLLTDYLPGGQVRAVLWRNFGDGEESAVGGTVTEYVSGVGLVKGTTQVQGGTSWDTAWLDSELAAPEREQYSPPDYGRHTFPNYPRLPNLVQINKDQAAPGEEVQPNADGLHKARVRRWVNDTMATLEDCWLMFVDDFDNLQGQVKGIQGEFYGPARLSGVKTSNDSRLPLYVVVKGESLQVIKFRLTQKLYLGESAVAKILTDTTSAFDYTEGAEIRVWDWFSQEPGMFRGEVGYEGMAVKHQVDYPSTANGGSESDPNLPDYDIIWMEGKARWIHFTLQEEIQNQLVPVKATLDDWHIQGREPEPDEEEGGSEGDPPFIYVYDTHGLFLFAPIDASGMAKYNDREDRYEIVWVEHILVLARAKLKEAMCGAQATFKEFTGNRIFNHVIIKGVDENAEGVAQNPFKHYGEEDDEILMYYQIIAEGDNVEPGWRVIDVTKKFVEVPIGRPIFTSTKWLQYFAQVALEYCTPPYLVEVSDLTDCAPGSVQGSQQ